jgi:hypothetical protein
MPISCSRRSLLVWAAAVAALPHVARAVSPVDPAPGWSLPIRVPGDIPGNGLLIRHGFACENTWFSPGNWHTAEDWYRDGDAETAGAEVLAMTAGEVAWIGSDYPGRVVLILHANGLYGMYGHLDPEPDVAVGQQVTAGQVLGRVLRWSDGRAPSHLHVELRDFFLNPIVNGDTPMYGFNCGYRCPPGPGYWPIADTRHPAQVGWRNPSHVIARGLDAGSPPTEVVVASGVDGQVASLRETPDVEAEVRVQVQLRSGARLPVAAIRAGAPDSTETSALGYQVWYEVKVTSGSTGWLQALVPDGRDFGSDGRPSSLRPVVLPAAGV